MAVNTIYTLRIQHNNYMCVSTHAHSTCTSYVLYTFILRICASKRNDTLASKRSIASKKTINKVFLCCDEPVGTYILGSTCAWWQKTTNRHTHGTTTVTLAVHARQGLINILTHARTHTCELLDLCKSKQGNTTNRSISFSQ